MAFSTYTFHLKYRLLLRVRKQLKLLHFVISRSKSPEIQLRQIYLWQTFLLCQSFCFSKYILGSWRVEKLFCCVNWLLQLNFGTRLYQKSWGLHELQFHAKMSKVVQLETIDQMIALQNLRKMFFISSKKLFSFFPFLSTLSGLKRTNWSGIIYDVMNWLAWICRCIFWNNSKTFL